MLAGVFSFFATMGFVQLLMAPARVTLASGLGTVFIYGFFAVGYALLSVMRKFRWLPLWAVLHFASFFMLANLVHPAETHDKNVLQKRISLFGFSAIATLTVGYFLFVFFIRREGDRYFRVQTEMELAREIHHSLVPQFERRAGAFEVFGASVASGAVGGDLVDLAEYPGGWISYIADISGHGVSSGVLMAMFKTSIRSRLASGGSPDELLEEVHRTLYPLKVPNMFVTAGVLQLSNGNGVRFSLAGHPPLIHYCRSKREIQEYPAQNLPVGILPEQRFTADSLQCDAGDILLLLTDGLTEVFNGKNSELGLEPLKNEFLKSADLPLREIFERLRKISLGFGRQDDDQTILLARYGE